MASLRPQIVFCELKYSTYARAACWEASKMPGTGPEMSATLARVIVLSVMPVWFLKPSHEPAFAVPVGEPLPFDLPPASPFCSSTVCGRISSSSTTSTFIW